MSGLAYFDDAEIFSRYGALGKTTHIRADDSSTEAYVLEDEDNIFVVFPGTEVDEGIADVLTDVRFANRKQFHDMKLHRGFWEAWASVAAPIAEEVYRRLYASSPLKSVVYCGHSLGGALAAIGAATHNPQRCITFGQPHVAGKRFVEFVAAKRVKYTRVVLCGDPVPSLLAWHPHYRHGGDLVFIDKEFNAHYNPALSKRIRLRGLFGFDVDSHSAFEYQMATWGAQYA